MNREEIIKYGLIVLLSILIVFILMRVLDLNYIKSLFIKEKFSTYPFNGPTRKPSGNRDTPAPQNVPVEHKVAASAAPVQPTHKSSGVSGYVEGSNMSDASAEVVSSDSGPSINFKACDLNDNVKPEDLLPSGNSEFASLNPVLDGGLKNKQFLDPSKLMGTNTIGQSNRNQSYDLRSEPAIPKMDVGPWMNTTIEADLTRRPLE